MISIDLKHSKVSPKELDCPALWKKVAATHKIIRDQSGATENAWVELPNSVTADELKRINDTAEWIRKNSDVLLVIGVGGSYLGARAGLQLLAGWNSFPVEFLGTSFDPIPVLAFLEKYKNKRVCVNVISKSGTTMEITAVFDIIKSQMKIPKSHLIFTTDARKGSLREMATKDGITSFVVPDRVGGRYSSLSAVGLLPFAVAGLDINAIMLGAKQAYSDLNNETNAAYKYACTRYILNTKYKKDVEVLASFYEKMEAIGWWWQQLFGESEGKNGSGLFVSSMIFSRDLHSMGQYLQEGKPLLFETVINVKKPPNDLLRDLNNAAFLGTVKAHSDAGVPVVILNMEEINSTNFGYLIYFFETACAMSAYLIGVNPFDQPGVEAYKKNMKEILNN